MANSSSEHSAMNAAAVTGGQTTAPAMQAEQPSMALVPASAPATTSTALSVAQPGALAASSSMHTQAGIIEVEEPWPFVTKALMLAVMGSQPAAAAAGTLLAVFRPLVDGWGATRKESKRWKERAEAYMADHHKHKTEAAQKHDALQAQVQALQRSLAESESKVRELEFQSSSLRSSASSLEKKLAEAEAALEAAKRAHAQETQERKEEAEASAKSARDANAAYEKLRQEADNKSRTQTAEINTLLERVKEIEAVKAKLEERLGSTVATNASLEAQIQQQNRDMSSLQNRVTELNTRKEALERQVQLYQRLPTRRF